METRSRLVTTALLVLIAVGGAGLAVAADRPHNPVHRPELTWAADRSARPWIEAAQERLRSISAEVAALVAAGRATLGELQTLDGAAVRQRLDDGAAALGRIETTAGELTELAQQPGAQVERWRLGPSTSDSLERIDEAITSVGGIAGQWARIDARAESVAELLDLLVRHDAHVFRATTAGRQARWSDALGELEQAVPLMDAAREKRIVLAVNGSVETLDDLLQRYEGYDSALRHLYEYVNETGNQSGARFDRFEDAVEEAQAALPSDNGVLSVIVGETAAAEIAEALVALEQARGHVLGALDDESRR